MERWVIEDDDLPLERKSLLPGEGFFVPDDIRDAHEDRKVEEAVAGADVVVVTDPDADGLACAAIVREALGEGALVPTGPNDLADGLRRAAEFGEPGADVFVCDLCPDEFESIDAELDALVERAGSVHWFDHHQWDEDVYDAVADRVDLEVGDSGSECTADVAYRVLRERYDLPGYLEELAAVTRDHDLWIKEDPRSDDVADFAYWAEDRDLYVETVRKHGVDLPEDVREYLAERRVEKEALVDRAVDRAALHAIGDWTVAATYGRCSQNEVAETLRVDHGADAAVVVKPSGAASIRGSEGFQRCHEVARTAGGGGHPKAAGCKPDLYDDMLDYAYHWVTQGEMAKRTLLDGFRDLAAEEADDGAREG